MYQKCELATSTSRDPLREGDESCLHVCSASTFSEDLDEFIKTVNFFYFIKKNLFYL